MNYNKTVKELRDIADLYEEMGVDHLQRKTMREAADMIERLTWVSVEERLPEYFKDYGFSKVVWCLDAHGKTGFGIYQKELQHKGWFIGGGAGENSAIITHWMPLPELPGEGDNR
ncbi:MAG: DUF551 domain-containing protein [Eubacteriales bacterium]|jgi:hypothetical protein